MPTGSSVKDGEDPAIRFVLGGKIQTLTKIDPSMTVLQYLRELEMRTGTKEACGEGGCGACTVVLADLDEEERIQYRSINACLHLLPQLDGHVLLTVEDLKAMNGQLHPVQQALVESHASQCGFCTPGIAMSLFALYQSHKTFEREEIVNALSGNLCRCTGYRSIVDAASRLFAMDPKTADRKAHQVHTGSESPCAIESVKCELRELLRSLKRTRHLALQGRTSTGKTINYLVPVNVAELSEMLCQYKDAVLCAGGTDIGPLVVEYPQKFDTVIFIGKVKELRGVAVSDTWITIGAATTLTEAHPVIARYYPAFGELLQRFGSPAVRNLATFGGNIAGRSPVSDILPALMALNGRLILRAGTVQRTVPVEAFHAGDQNDGLASGGFIESIQLPLPQESCVFSTYKISKRQDCDIAAINAAFRMELKDNLIHQARICYGGMAPAVRRAMHCERALTGQPWTADTVTAASEMLDKDFVPTTDVRASSTYRMLVAKNLLRRWYLEAILPPERLQVAAYQKTYAARRD